VRILCAPCPPHALRDNWTLEVRAPRYHHVTRPRPAKSAFFALHTLHVYLYVRTSCYRDGGRGA